MKAYVYTAVDASGKVLYVGRTKQPNIRLSTHARKAEWFPMASEIKFTEFGSAMEAAAFETESIASIRPAFNVTGNPDATRDLKDYVRINLNVDRGVRRMWKAEALKRGITLGQLIAEAVESYAAPLQSIG